MLLRLLACSTHRLPRDCDAQSANAEEAPDCMQKR
jgi:hypothetical protein